MTFNKWATECNGKANETHVKRLEEFFGEKQLTRIGDDDLVNYRKKRSTEKMIRHGKLSKVGVSQTTINKDVSTLRKLLGMARKKGIHDELTAFPMTKEPSRRRTLDAEKGEYKNLLDSCPAWVKARCGDGLRDFIVTKRFVRPDVAANQRAGGNHRTRAQQDS